MWFKRFEKICKKYNCSFDLFGSADGVYLTIYPYGSFRAIELASSKRDYNSLFKRAIKEIKNY